MSLSQMPSADSAKAQRVYCDLLTLRRPTSVDQLLGSVRKPRGHVPEPPEPCLPLWTTLPLDAKLPIPVSAKTRGPQFCRDKLGKKLWRTTPGQDFLLNDPYCHEVSYEYDALHDEHLADFFKRPVHKQRLNASQLVSKNDGAVCTLKKFNQHRRYLKRLHAQAVNKERAKLESTMQEEFVLRRAQEQLDKEVLRQQVSSEHHKRMQQARDKCAQEYQDRRQEWLLSQQRHAARVDLLRVRKEEQRLRIAVRSHKHDEEVWRRVAKGKDLARKKVVETKIKTRTAEGARQERVRQRKQDKLTKSLEADDEEWEKKMKCQEDRLNNEKRILEEFEQDAKRRVEMRDKHVRNQRDNVAELLSKIEAKKLRKMSNLNSVWAMDEMVKALQDGTEHGWEGLDDDAIKRSLRLQMAANENKPDGKDMLSILQGAKSRLDKELNAPPAVNVAIEALLNNVIKQHVRKALHRIIRDVINKASVKQSDSGSFLRKSSLRPPRPSIQRASLAVQLPAPEESQLSIGGGTHRRSSLPGHGLSENRPKLSSVCFGRTEKIECAEEHTGSPLLKTIDRPPTPVPSLISLVAVAVNEPVDLTQDDQYAFVEQRELSAALCEFSGALLREVSYRLSQGTLTAEIRMNMNVVVERLIQTILNKPQTQIMDACEVNHICNFIVRDIQKKANVDAAANSKKRMSSIQNDLYKNVTLSRKSK